MPKENFFKALNAFFDHIYVITLQRATDRHAHLKTELAGLSYELFFGKDKKTFSVEELQQQGIYNESIARLNHRYGKGMSSGQIGCAWSHAEVYRDAKQKGYQRILILEDDVIICENAIEQWNKIVTEIPPDWELLYLGFAKHIKPSALTPVKKLVYHFQRRFGSLKYSHATINHLYPKKVSAHIYEAGYHDCTHAYALTLSGTEKLAALQQPVSFVADNLLAYAATNSIVRAYVTLPQTISQQALLGIDSVSYLNE